MKRDPGVIAETPHFDAQLALNSSLELFLFGGAAEDRDIMYERDSYSRAGDSARWLTGPDSHSGHSDRGTIVGSFEVDLDSRTVKYFAPQAVE